MKIKITGGDKVAQENGGEWAAINLAKNLRILRLKNKYTQGEVARYLHISRSTYTYYETGKTEPSISSLAALCRLYAVGVGELIEMPGVSACTDGKQICEEKSQS